MVPGNGREPDKRRNIMKKLTAVILSICLGAAGLAGCQSGQQAREARGRPGQRARPGQAQDPGQGRNGRKGQDRAGPKVPAPGRNRPGKRIPGRARTKDRKRPKARLIRKSSQHHAGNQVEIPNQVNRVVVTDIFPIPSIITVLLGSGEKVVGMNPASMSAARTGLLGELFPDILNAGTDFMNGSDINMEELMKLEPDVVIYSAGKEGVREKRRVCKAGICRGGHIC